MSAIIDYKNVEVLRKELLVLKNVNFQLEEGQFVYLIGRVGSGKSSLMKTMYAEVPIEMGEARIFDYDLSAIRRKDVPMLRRQIGVVFQDFQLLSDRSVYDNLLFVLKATGWKNKTDIDERINEVLSEVGMEHKSYKMPHELSGGEQQRIALARAILKDAPIVVLDEATAFADPENEALIQKAFTTLTKGRTVIMIAHRLSTVVGADKILVLEGGRVVEQGSHRELVETGGLYTRMWADYNQSVQWKITSEEEAK